MKLPNVENAFVPQEKITAYLLSEERSGGKATFFNRFGFSVVHWRQFESALLVHIENSRWSKSTGAYCLDY